jgi:WD40 repeat protein
MRSAAWSPDGTLIATGDDIAARIWDGELRTLKLDLLHPDIVYDVRYTPDSARLVTACGDGAVRVWNAHTGKLERELRAPGGGADRYYLSAVSPDGSLVAAIDLLGAMARVWRTDRGDLVAELPNDGRKYPAIAFSADGRWLATGGGDDVRVFDTANWRRALTLTGAKIGAFAFDPARARIVIGSRDDAAIYAIPDGKLVRRLREGGAPVDAVAFSPDGAEVVTVGRDGVEQIWAAASGKQIAQATLHGAPKSVAFAPSSRAVVASVDTGSVEITDATSGFEIARLNAGAVVRAALFDPFSARVLGASADGDAYVWHAGSQYRRWSTPSVDDDCGDRSTISYGRHFAAIGCASHPTRIWDFVNGQLVAELPASTGSAPAVSADGELAAVASGVDVDLYDLPSGHLARRVRHTAQITALAFAQRGHDLVSGATDGSLLITRAGSEPAALAGAVRIDAAAILSDGRVVAADAGSVLHIFGPGEHLKLPLQMRVQSLSASADAQRLVIVPTYTGPEARPVLFDLRAPRAIAALGSGSGRVISASFTDDHTVLTAGNDGAVRRWNADDGQLAATYLSRARFLWSATILGSSVVAGGAGGELWYWDLITGRLLWRLHAHTDHIVGVLVDDDGDIVTLGNSGDLALWSLSTPE